jgi:hypothetical protein
MTTSRTHTDVIETQASGSQSLSIDNLILDFSERLLAAVELATIKRGEAIIAQMFSEIERSADSNIGKAAKKQADHARNQRVSELTQTFLDTIEQPLNAHVRAMLAHELSGAPRALSRAQAAEESSEMTASVPTLTPPRKRTRRARPNLLAPPPLDPEQIKRDQEFARLRALLKPVTEERFPPAPAPGIVVPPLASPQQPATPGDTLHTLEKEIQNAVPTLGRLGPERCGAQIAVWAGQVRALRERLSPELSAAMRPAFRIFLEHLTQLRMEMEAHIVDALEPNWTAPDWESYVEVHRARVEQRAPELTSDRLRLYYHAMLRALVLPHRRNVPQQAMPIITGASEALTPGDTLLRSAVRRHSSAWKVPSPSQDAPAAPPVAEGAPATLPVAPVDTAPMPDAPAEAPAQNAGESPAVPMTGEFDSTWTK